MTYTLITNGTLIDGNGGKPINDAAILIKNNQIIATGRLNDIPQVNGNVQKIDAEEGFILPGLFDTHVHMMFQQTDYNTRFQTPFSFKFYKAIEHFKRTIEVGITTVRDAGFTDVGVKKAVDEGLIQGPRLQVSIVPLTITGGHGDGWTRSGINLTDPTYPTMPSGIVDGTEQITKKVREVLRAGADVIKVHATGGVLSPTDHPEFTQFSLEELKIIVREAKFRKGIKVMAHAQGSEGIKNAIRAGVHSIEHGIFLDDEAIELMLEKGTYLVPTLLAPVSVLEQFESSSNIPKHAEQKTREVIDIHRESFSKAYRAGVKIAMGTDAGVMPHGTNLRELGLMVNGGMSPMEAIVATTKTAAELMGWDDKLGTVEKGKIADLVITKTDPLNSIKSLENPKNIVLVIKDGKIVKDIRNKIL